MLQSRQKVEAAQLAMQNLKYEMTRLLGEIEQCRGFRYAQRTSLKPQELLTLSTFQVDLPRHDHTHRRRVYAARE